MAQLFFKSSNFITRLAIKKSERIPRQISANCLYARRVDTFERLLATTPRHISALFSRGTIIKSPATQSGIRFSQVQAVDPTTTTTRGKKLGVREQQQPSAEARVISLACSRASPLYYHKFPSDRSEAN